MSLAVDVISDVICPWCYIGKRRLEKAVAAFGGPEKLRWLPFQLNPAVPKEGMRVPVLNSSETVTNPSPCWT